MHVGRHEIWPADWVGVGFMVSAVVLILLARKLGRGSTPLL